MLAATVRSFAHMPLGISNRNKLDCSFLFPTTIAIANGKQSAQFLFINFDNSKLQRWLIVNTVSNGVVTTAQIFGLQVYQKNRCSVSRIWSILRKAEIVTKFFLIRAVLLSRARAAKKKNTLFVAAVTIQPNRRSICRYILFSRHKTSE